MSAEALRTGISRYAMGDDLADPSDIVSLAVERRTMTASEEVQIDRKATYTFTE